VAVKTAISLNLKYLNQLLKLNSTQKLSWNHLMSHTGIIRKGPTPKWFCEFNNPDNLIGNHGPIPNQWAVFWFLRPSQTIVKVHKRSQPINPNEILQGKHFLLTTNDYLLKCPGCPKGRSHNNSCVIQFTSSIVTSL
jgi:hypothetical protein